MNQLEKGQYFGTHYQELVLEDLVITDTAYTHKFVDWHYHTNPYFTYLLEGNVFEANKKESYWLTPGKLLFHNWEDAHYNIKSDVKTRGFHLELSDAWLKKYDITGFKLEGSNQVNNPLIKALMNRILYESKQNDIYSKTSIESDLLDIFTHLNRDNTTTFLEAPSWVKQLKEIVLDSKETTLSLSFLSNNLQLHPTHLSREFNRYFGTTLGNYIRNLRLNKAILLMQDKRKSMTEICYECGFYDQSHFISTFKKMYRKSPSKFRRSLAPR